MSQDEFVSWLVSDKNKQAARKAKARQSFNELVKSLTNGKRTWTHSERMQFNRVAAFLEA